MNHTECGKKGIWRNVIRVMLVVALIACVAVLAVACNTQDNDGVKLYWNVDGVTYRSPDMDRMADSEGVFYVTLLCDGVQERYPARDIAIVNKLDMLDVMGLVFDEEGFIVDVARVEDITGGYAADRYFISSIEGNTVTCNSSSSFQGLNKTFQITEDTPVWDVGGVGITCGLPGKLQVDDQVIAVMDKNGNVTVVFTIPYKQPPDIYWNVTRKYSSTTKTTTREQDVLGKYEVELVCNGVVGTYYVRDPKIINKLDGMAARCFALQFDDDGLIVDVIHAGTATGGGSAASWYHCIDTDGTNAEFEKRTDSNAGATYSGIMSRNVKVFDVTGLGESLGEETTLQKGDQAHCLLDSRGNICIIFIVGGRKANSEIYWNVDRKWDSKTSQTTRTPGADGYYRIKVAVQGKQMWVKTTDKSIVQSIDSRAAKCFGLKLDGDEIVKFYTPDQTVGGSTFASWYDVQSLNGNKIVVTKQGTGDTKEGKIRDDCEIYNVSVNAAMVGEKTTVRVGDRIHSLKDADGNICVIFVVSRFENLPIYWNITRKYANGATTRKPDAEGYYVFEMAYNGQLVTVKTKSKSVANDIDSQAAKAVALSVSKDGIVYRAIHPKETINCKGGGTSSWAYVTSVSKYGFTTRKIDSVGNVTKTYNESFAGGCRIYNVSTNFVNNRGEKTTLQVGDFVHCLKDGNNNVSYVFVMERFENLGVYYNLDRNWTGSASGRTPDADGLYSFRMAHNGEEVIVKTADVEVANAIDYEVAKCVGIEFDENGLAIRALHAKATQECQGGIGVSYATVTAIDPEAKTVTTNKDGTITTFPVSDNANYFNVSADFENNQGERTELRVGDYIHCLKGADGKTKYIYIMSRVKVMPVVEHECEHVTEDVTWYEWDGTEPITLPGYYVLTGDVTNDGSIRSTINAGEEVTLCLNGHTVSSTDRFFSVYGTLNICDHKLSDGTYAGKLSSSFTASGYGGIFYSYNDKGNSQVNIYGGILEHTGKLTCGGIGYVGNTSTSDYTSVLNIYDGVLTGGNTTGNGAGIFISNFCEVNMHGGKITNCKTSQSTDINGGGINVEKGTLNMTGGIIDGNKAYEGGNIRVGPSGVATISGDAVIMNGQATNGGNITVLGTLTIQDGATVKDGVVTGTGANISAFAAKETVHAEVNLDNATITGGSIRLGANLGQVTMVVADSTVSGDILVNTGNVNMYVSGKVNLSKVNLTAGKEIIVGEDGLDDSSRIAVAMADTSTAFTTITDSNDEACFVPADPEMYKVVNKGGNLYLEGTIEKHIHCVCGGHLNVGDHTTCDGTVEWKPWDGTGALGEGNYYLYDAGHDGKITISGTLDITSGKTTALCLNGLTLESSSRVFQVNGVSSGTTNFTLTDCGTTGTVKSSSTGASPILHSYTNNRGTVVINIFGGKYMAVDNDYSKEGGAIRLGNTTASTQKFYGTLNMYGGEITGGCATYGGNLIISPNCTFNMYDGKITGGKTTGDSANIQLIVNAAANLLGGEITGGNTGGKGSIYGADSVITVGGDVKISGCAGGNLYLASGKTVNIHQDGLEDAAEIYITMATNGVFANITDSKDASCFKSDNTAYTVENNSGALSLVANSVVEPEPEPTTHTHCACNGQAQGKPGHTCADVPYLPWVSNNSLPVSGNYYLTVDVTLSSTYEVTASNTLNLCLNGHKIESSTRILKVRGVANLSDCGTTGKLIGNQTSTTLGPVFYIYSGSTFNLFGGELTVSSTSKVAQAGIGGVQAGTMNMYGGYIHGGNVTNSGGNICIFDGGTLKIYGGTIADGTAGKSAGNILVSKGHLEIHGGTITNGLAAGTTTPGTGEIVGTGGNIRVDYSTAYNNTFTMTDGTVSNGKTGKKQDMSGGNIDVRGYQASITGGIVEGGEAYEGGNIRVGNSAPLTIGGDAIIRNGVAVNAGGNMAVYSNLVIEGDAEISGGQAGKSAGNISSFANLSTAVVNITITGGTISGGTAGERIGSVRTEVKDGTINFTMTGGTIENGTAPLYSCMYVGAGNINLTVGGDAKIHEVNFASGEELTLSTETPLDTEDGGIGVALTNGTGVFVRNVTDEEIAKFFTATGAGMTIVYDEDADTLAVANEN